MFRNRKSFLLVLGLLLAVSAAYLNHFHNEFHFDDSHTIVNNRSAIGSLRNIPRFFTDATLFSVVPAGQTWRPLVTASLAIDYWLGHGLKPFWFHVSTFLWFLVQLVLMWFLFRRIMDHADAHPSNIWVALFAVACYGLHPANAETVNYIIQRADLYNALGVVASLLWFAAYPAQRKRGWYLIPAAAACMAKAPALIFPLILLAYVFLFEQDGTIETGDWPANRKKWLAAVRAVLPALLVAAVLGVLTIKLTPATFKSGATAPWLYRFTQPWIALHYFKCFFLPTDLSADSDWTVVSSAFNLRALVGYGFVIALAWWAFRMSRQRETRPIAFGILWFFLALLPTSMMALADVTNDHRMFFPFVGLALAVVWSLRLALLHRTAAVRRAAVAAAVVVLVAAAFGTRERNRVWHTEESLWHDVVLKSPKNPRGLMSYGSVLMTHSNYTDGLYYLQRAAAFRPDDPILQANLGIALGALGRDAEAAAHFQHGVSVARDRWEPYFYYGRWLKAKERWADAATQLKAAINLNKLAYPARYMLMEVYFDSGKWNELETLTDETLQLDANNGVARRFVAETANRGSAQPRATSAPPTAMPDRRAAGTPEDLLRQATSDCRAARYDDCLTTARKALDLRPSYAEAYNVIAMALIATNRGDDGIQALRHALAIRPDYETAKKNLAWALAEKKRIQSGGR